LITPIAVHSRHVRQEPPQLFPSIIQQDIAPSPLVPSNDDNTTVAASPTVNHPKNPKPVDAQNEKNDQQTPIANKFEQLKKAAKEHATAKVVEPSLTTAGITTPASIPATVITESTTNSTPSTTTSQTPTNTTIDASQYGVKKQFELITQSVWRKVCRW
jgi:hypothetical protein